MNDPVIIPKLTREQIIVALEENGFKNCAVIPATRYLGKADARGSHYFGYVSPAGDGDFVLGTLIVRTNDHAKILACCMLGVESFDTVEKALDRLLDLPLIEDPGIIPALTDAIEMLMESAALIDGVLLEAKAGKAGREHYCTKLVERWAEQHQGAIDGLVQIRASMRGIDLDKDKDKDKDKQ